MIRVAETPKEREQIKGLNSKYTFFIAGHQPALEKVLTSLLSMRVYIHIDRQLYLVNHSWPKKFFLKLTDSLATHEIKPSI